MRTFREAPPDLTFSLRENGGSHAYGRDCATLETVGLESPTSVLPKIAYSIFRNRNRYQNQIFCPHPIFSKLSGFHSAISISISISISILA